jgi:hypothetical protein
MLTSGGASVRLSLSAAQLAAAGISIGDTVVISGGLGSDLSVDATSVIRSGEDGTPESVGGGADAGSGGSTSSSENQVNNPRNDIPSERDRPHEPDPAPEPSAGGEQTSGGTGGISSFPDWQPRRRYTTAWYTTPLDLDSSASELPSLTGN